MNNKWFYFVLAAAAELFTITWVQDLLTEIRSLFNIKKCDLVETKVLTSRTGSKKRELPAKWTRNPLARLPSAWIASTATAMLTSVISCIDNVEVEIIHHEVTNQFKEQTMVVNVSTETWLKFLECHGIGIINGGVMLSPQEKCTWGSQRIGNESWSASLLK